MWCKNTFFPFLQEIYLTFLEKNVDIKMHQSKKRQGDSEKVKEYKSTLYFLLANFFYLQKIKAPTTLQNPQLASPV